jgi:hypothetical protein
MLAFRNHQPANNDRTLDRYGPVWLREERPRKEKAAAKENLVNRKPKPLVQNHRSFLQFPWDLAKYLTCGKLAPPFSIRQHNLDKILLFLQ